MRRIYRLVTVCALTAASALATSCASEPISWSSSHAPESADELQIDTGTNVQEIWLRAAHNLDGR